MASNRKLLMVSKRTSEIVTKNNYVDIYKQIENNLHMYTFKGWWVGGWGLEGVKNRARQKTELIKIQ